MGMPMRPPPIPRGHRFATNRCSLPDIDDRAIPIYHMRHRLSKRAFAITLTELSAIAAPATTGLR